jgi:hypothetical protein
MLFYYFIIDKKGTEYFIKFSQHIVDYRIINSFVTFISLYVHKKL